MDYPYFFLPYKFLGDEVMGYISHPNFISSWMMGFLRYHEKLGDVLSYGLGILNLWTSTDVTAAQKRFSG